MRPVPVWVHIVPALLGPVAAVAAGRAGLPVAAAVVLGAVVALVALAVLRAAGRR